MTIRAILWALILALLQGAQALSAADYFRDRFHGDGAKKAAPAAPRAATNSKAVSRFSSYFDQDKAKPNLRGSASRRDEARASGGRAQRAGSAPASVVSALRSVEELADNAVARLHDLQAERDKLIRLVEEAKKSDAVLSKEIADKYEARPGSKVRREGIEGRKISKPWEGAREDGKVISRGSTRGKVLGISLGKNAAPVKSAELERAEAEAAAVVAASGKKALQAAERPNGARPEWWNDWKGGGEKGGFDIIESGVLKKGVNVAQINDASAMGVNKAAAAAAAEHVVPNV